MFGKLKNLRRLERGLEVTMTMNLFGLPEILVVHHKYTAFTTKKINILKKTHPTATVTTLLLNPEWTCEQHAAQAIRTLMHARKYDKPDLVTVRYFGFDQKYVDEVGRQLNVSLEGL